MGVPGELDDRDPVEQEGSPAAGSDPTGLETGGKGPLGAEGAGKL